MDGYKHYVRTDVNNNVIYGLSDAFESMQTGDVCINTNAPRQFNVTLSDSDGISLYKVASGQMVSRTSAEMDVDRLPVTKNKKIAELNGKCNQTILAGFTSSTISATPHNYDFDYEAQMNINGAYAYANNNATATFDWKTVDAGVISHSSAQIKQLFADGMVWKQTQINKYRNLKTQVNAATSLAQVNAIFW